MAVPASRLEAALKKDRAVVLIGLIAVVVLAWSYILAGAGMGMGALEMTAMSSASGSPAMAALASDVMTPARWSPGYAALMFFMWWIMMVAMMLPSAAPMVLIFAAFNRKQRERGASYIPAGFFVLGYVIVWGAFSLAATALQGGLERTGLLSSMMTSTSVHLGGAVLLAAGLWQLTPLKHACLRHCRSPLYYLSHHWRKGRLGALRMGVEHGVFCLGCCWFLMGLLFYGGVMNLYWIAGLAAYVLLEKVVPAGHWLGYATGAGLVVWGGVLLVTVA